MYSRDTAYNEANAFVSVIVDGLVHEGAVIVRIRAKHRKRHLGSDTVHRLNDEQWVANRHRLAFAPATGNIGQHQAMHVVAVRLGATAVLDPVNLQKARWRVTPVGEGTHRNTAPDCSTDTHAPLSLPIDLLSGRAQRAVDRGRTHTQQLGPDRRFQTQVSVPMHRIQ